jgi:membrane protein YqaA with SNARE-associated domain
MLRLAALGVIGLGSALLIAAVLLSTYTSGKIRKIPLNIDQTLVSAGTGTALDPVLLGIVAGLGSAVGELSGYLAGTSGRALVPAHQRAQFERLHSLTDRYGAILLLLLSAIPFPLFDFAGIIAGMLRIRIVTFLSMVAVGKSIKYVIMILLGAGPLIYLQQLFGQWFGS